MKDCPDLTKLSFEKKEEFWSQCDPRKLKRLGDRLLAESLPHVEPSKARELTSAEAAESLSALGWSIEQAAEVLGVTPDLLFAWQADRVKPPESLAMVIRRLKELEADTVQA